MLEAQQFREASGSDESAQTKQVSTLLYCLEEEAESVLAHQQARQVKSANYSTK